MFERDSIESVRTRLEDTSFKLWCRYYKQRDVYERKVCTWVNADGSPAPANCKEKALINHNAYQNHLLLQELADRIGMDAYTFNGGKLEAKKAFDKKTQEYKQATEGVYEAVIL